MIPYTLNIPEVPPLYIKLKTDAAYFFFFSLLLAVRTLLLLKKAKVIHQLCLKMLQTFVISLIFRFWKVACRCWQSAADPQITPVKGLPVSLQVIPAKQHTKP